MSTGDRAENAWQSSIACNELQTGGNAAILSLGALTDAHDELKLKAHAKQA